MLEKPAVRPYRYYRQKVDSTGLVGYAVATWPESQALNDLMAKGSDVITEAEIEHKTRELGIGLVGDDLRNIVDHLNLMRVTVHAKDVLSPALGPYEEDIKSVERCMNELLRKMPKVIEAHLKVDTERAFVSAARFYALLQATMAYQGDRWIAFGGRPLSRRTEPWHGDAVYLMALYNRARGKSDFLSGVNAKSAIVAFIAWAIDRTGNGHHKPEAIAQALNRRNRPAE
jgi:hypothetical protein